ncbi:hypothetical protein D3C75_627410 [compost metagenome]
MNNGACSSSGGANSSASNSASLATAFVYFLSVVLPDVSHSAIIARCFACASVFLAIRRACFSHHSAILLTLIVRSILRTNSGLVTPYASITSDCACFNFGRNSSPSAFSSSRSITKPVRSILTLTSVRYCAISK